MLTLADLPGPFITAIAVALGLAFGSFLNVVIYRLPRGESLSHPPSRCPGCGKAIRIYDNIPLLGWLFLRGRARCCKIRISARYPLIEALGGLLAWAIVRAIIFELPDETSWWMVVISFALYLALTLGLLAAAIIDLEHMYLPDPITIGGALLGLLSVPLRGGTFQGALLGAALGFLLVWLPFDFLYSKLRGLPGMGLGDAKLMMLAGAWLGWQGAVFALLGGAVQATVVALAVYLARGRIDEPEAVIQERKELQALLESSTGEARAELEREIARDPLAFEPEAGLGKARLAFGPFLALATVEYLLFGDVIVQALFP
ncbi:MAG TPA: prepilin peptidase [Polyangiaceae bacterium]|nr:prepilin peptidase [Polyangiaceae bacterium]